jgi:formylglycine-generating enzyme required for sulfatase activity
MKKILLLITLLMLPLFIFTGCKGCVGNPNKMPVIERDKLPDGNAMVAIKGGAYIIGDKRGETDEQPEIEVAVRDFEIDAYEVMNKDYEEFIKAGGYDIKNAEMMKFWSADGFQWLNASGTKMPYKYYLNPEKGKIQPIPGWDAPDQPVAGVSWYEAEAYARWIGKRLPTNAEWEAAARGKARRKWPWGDELKDDDKSKLNCWRTLYNVPTQVGVYEEGKTPEGVYDMAGNLMEWVDDWYSEDAYSTKRFNQKTNPPQKTIRGGSFDNRPEFCTTYWRYSKEPEYRWANVGFRCARDKK